MSPAAVFNHRVALVLLALLALAGCRSGPDLQSAREAVSRTSPGEGRRLLEEGRAADAVAVFRQRIRQEGADLWALNGLAIAYNELGKPDLAAEMFARALAITPNDPATLNNIGFAALRRADGQLARHYLEKARLGDGGFEKIEGNLARLALFEKMDLKRWKRRAFKPAALSSEDRTSSRAMTLSLPKNGSPSSLAIPVSNDRPSRPSQHSMIDFTAVIDPFSQNRPVE